MILEELEFIRLCGTCNRRTLHQRKARRVAQCLCCETWLVLRYNDPTTTTDPGNTWHISGANFSMLVGRRYMLEAIPP
jgi:hypothetical protein